MPHTGRKALYLTFQHFGYPSNLCVPCDAVYSRSLLIDMTTPLNSNDTAAVERFVEAYPGPLVVTLSILGAEDAGKVSVVERVSPDL